MPQRGRIYLLKLFCICAIAGAPLAAAGRQTETQPHIEEAFSPYQGATALVKRVIDDSHESVEVAAYSFTSYPIADALIAARRRGVQVRVVLDKSQLRARYSLAAYLAQNGVETRINSRYAIMHDKFMIIDGHELELGSFNYTASAESRNAENVLVIHDDVPVVTRYQGQWEQLWAGAACRLVQSADAPECG